LHVNIKDTAICHSFLKVDGDENAAWSPVLGLQGLLVGISNIFFPGVKERKKKNPKTNKTNKKK